MVIFSKRNGFFHLVCYLTKYTLGVYVYVYMYVYVYIFNNYSSSPNGL